MSKVINDAHHIKARPFIVALLFFLIQIGVFILVYHFFREKLSYFGFLQSLFGVMCIIYIINRPISSSYHIAWLVVIAALPLFGALLYLFLHIMPGVDRLNARLESQVEATKRYISSLENTLLVKKADEKFNGLALYLYERCQHPATSGNKLTYYPSGEEAIDALKLALRQARKFIFMEYFIVAEGDVWQEIYAILKAKAKEGVEVRFMYDGSCFNLPKGFQRNILKEGIACRVFSPISPFISTYQNNRDHRKITVIDGKVGFTGGFNLADEYVNKKLRFGYWKDAGLKIVGVGVDNLTASFLQMWHMVNDTIETDMSPYFQHLPLELPDQDNPTWAIGYADAPGDGESLGENIYLHLLYHAKKYVHIMTPYLILDDIIIKGLTQASKKGVEVAIILPHIPDKKIPFYIARSYYDRLLEAGIKIYEYTPGFLHAKVWVVDGEFATVGTVNLDFRSLYLNFENGILCYDKSLCETIEKDFQETFSASQVITQWFYRKRPLYQRLSGRIARVFGALM